MEAVEYPLTIEQGSTFQKQFRWKVDGQVMNLTGYTAKMQARKAYGGALGFELSTENSCILLGGAAGTVALEMTPETTSTLVAGNYVYDLELYVGGVVRKLIRGTVVVVPESTISCDSGGATVLASSDARTSLRVTVTNEKPYLTITSSGYIDLICADYWNGVDRPTRPNAPFTAPEQLRIYVGNTLLSSGSNFNGITSLRGPVSANIHDSGYFDNCGSYGVNATVCPK